MKRMMICLCITLMMVTNISAQAEKPKLAKIVPVVDDYFGIKITDPYRYMENLEDPYVKTWLKDQSLYAEAVLGQIPGRKTLVAELTDMSKRDIADAYSVTVLENDWFFYLKREGGAELEKLCYRDGYRGEETVLFDPSELSSGDDSLTSIAAYYPSPKGDKVALCLKSTDSNKMHLRIMDTQTKTFFPETFKPGLWIMCSWLADGKSLLYSQFDHRFIDTTERDKHAGVFLHVMGEPVERDFEWLSRKTNPELFASDFEIPYVFPWLQSDYFFAYLYTVDRNQKIYFTPRSAIKGKKPQWQKLCDRDDEVKHIYAAKDLVYLFTTRNAPNFKLMKVPLTQPDLEKAETVIDHHEADILSDYQVTSNGVYFVRVSNGLKKNLFFKAHGKNEIQKIELPFAAGAIQIQNKSPLFPDLWVSLSGWTQPSRRYRHDSKTHEFITEELITATVFPGVEDLECEELMVPSHDGVMVPLSLVYKKGLKKNGENIVFMSGYGAYGVHQDPGFNPKRLALYKRGVVFALAHVRGGGALGSNWHKTGQKSSKSNSWKDLIACAEFLIEKGYAEPKMISIFGGSAGGILVGRAMTERPDLFAAVIPSVGLMNTLRMEAYPNGPVNTAEFGTVKNEVECKGLMDMDAYLHVKDGLSYPGVLALAGMNDVNVVAWQPAKFAARLMSASASERPILMLTDFNSDHSLAISTSQDIMQTANIYSFALWQTGHPEFKPHKD